MNKIKSYLIGEIISSNTAEAHALYKKSCFGQPTQGKIQYNLSEVLFLVEKNKMQVYDGKGKLILEKNLIQKFRKIDKKIQIKYPVYKDLREKGYVIKTALKFGADFRIYDKGKRPGKAHAKWILFVEHESKKSSWHEFSAKNRVAHSTKKKLLIAIIDEEADISYYEVGWVRP